MKKLMGSLGQVVLRSLGLVSGGGPSQGLLSYTATFGRLELSDFKGACDCPILQDKRGCKVTLR